MASLLTINIDKKLKERKVAQIERLEGLLDKAIEIRNFEIQQLQSRNNFLLVAQAALIASGLKVLEAGGPSGLALSMAGIVMSIFQARMAAGAKFWQARWELAAQDAEKMYLEELRSERVAGRQMVLFIEPVDPRDARVGATREQRMLFIEIAKSIRARCKPRFLASKCVDNWINNAILKRYSVSRIPIHLALVLLVFWTIAFCFAVAFILRDRFNAISF